ncbi:DUF5629 family protein [Pseudomonas sp. R4-39-08]|uniref:DUF5629 family protein n=1 Tax=Pseudomonas sp. R4-39-08 TaxID=1173288 RepID=UPI000F570347|nr:DUF5629 family protein [Pseudomonas sp. R4-39-08]
MTADALLTELQNCDMLEIDGLHTFDFNLDDTQLRIELMDGRENKHWAFSLAQVQAATFDETRQSWTLTGDSGEHRLTCMRGFTGNNNDEELEHDDA